LTCEEDAVEQVLPEGDAQFSAGLVQAGERVTASETFVAAGSAADFLPHDMIADIAFTVISVKRYFRSIQHQQEFGFVIVNADQKIGELPVTCPAYEDVIKPFSQPFLLFFGWLCLVGFKIGIELPDLGSNPCNVLAMAVIERLQLMNQPFRMNPTQAMREDIELARIIADDDHVCCDMQTGESTQQGTLGGDLEFERCADAKRFQVRAPCLLIREDGVGMPAQDIPACRGHPLFFHVCQRVAVNHILGLPGLQNLKAVDPVFRVAGRETGEMLIADMGDITIFSHALPSKSGMQPIQSTPVKVGVRVKSSHEAARF
jgi:hypothetical protein